MTGKIKIEKSWPFFHAYHDCRYIISHDCRKTVLLREKKQKRKYILENKTEKEIIVYKVDDALIRSKAKNKCDYAIYTEDNCLILIELKGQDLDHAAKQIYFTIDTLLKQNNIKPQALHPRIVLSKVSCPRIKPTYEKLLEQFLNKTYGSCENYKKQCRILKESI